MGSNMFCRISQNSKAAFSLKIFVPIGWTSYVVLKERKMGVVVENLHLWPPRSIVGVGVKHTHDSDHAECDQ